MSRNCISFGSTYVKTVGIISLFFLHYKYASFHFPYQMHYCTAQILTIVCYIEYTHMNTFFTYCWKHYWFLDERHFILILQMAPLFDRIPIRSPVKSSKYLIEFTDRDHLRKIPVEIWLIPWEKAIYCQSNIFAISAYTVEAANFNPCPFAYARRRQAYLSGISLDLYLS